MRVLHLVKTSSGAGWAWREMNELVKLGDEVHVAMPLGGKNENKYRESGIIVHECRFSYKNLFQTIKALRELVEEVQPDIIHSHFVQTTILIRLALRKNATPRIFQVAGPLHLEHWITRNADLLTAQKGIDYWIPTCTWTYDRYVKSGISPERLELSYYGGYNAEVKDCKGFLRKELGLSESDIIVGMVAYVYAPKYYLGQFRGVKGHEDFIDACSLLMRKYDNLHAVCVGGPWQGAEKYYKKLVSRAVAKNPRIHFLGTRNNVLELYQDFNVAVHPSYSENLGGAGESQKMGVPTVATNVGGFPDLIIDGVTGLLVPPKNPPKLATAIETMFSNKEFAGKCVANGFIRRKEVGTVVNTAAQVHDFYRKILERKQK